MHTQTLQEIDILVEESRALEAEADRFSENHIRWVLKVQDFLKENFGEDSIYYKNFTSFTWQEEGRYFIGGPSRSSESHNPQLGIDRVNREAYLKQLKSSRGFLLAAKDELERKGVGSEGKIEAFLKKLTNSIDLCVGGLLKSEEFIGIKKEAEQLFEELFVDDKGAIIYRKFYKLKNSGDWIWNEVSRAGSGDFISPRKADILFKIDEILKEMLASSGTEIQETKTLISKGESFSARKTLRNIFQSANKKIAVMDSYLGSGVLDMLESCIGANPNIEVLLLTTNGNVPKFNSLSLDVKAIKNQYPNSKMELKKAAKLAHGRFILIDNAEIYNSGHSFDKLGESMDRIDKMSNDTEIQQVLKEFETEWSNAQVA